MSFQLIARPSSENRCSWECPFLKWQDGDASIGQECVIFGVLRTNAGIATRHGLCVVAEKKAKEVEDD